jgi:hypothetical protein
VSLGGNDGNGNGNGGNGNGARASVRAFKMTDVVRPSIIALMSGGQDDQHQGSSEADTIYHLIAQFIMDGGVSDESALADAMLREGYDTERLQAVLNSDIGVKEEVMEMMAAFGQRKMIQYLEAEDDDNVVESEREFDPMGNDAKGHDAVFKNPNSKSINGKDNNLRSLVTNVANSENEGLPDHRQMAASDDSFYTTWDKNCYGTGDRLEGFGWGAAHATFASCAAACEVGNGGVPCDVIEYGPTWGCFKCTAGVAKSQLTDQGPNKWNMKTYKSSYTTWDKNCHGTGNRLEGFGWGAAHATFASCAAACEVGNGGVPCDVIEYGPTWGCFKCTAGIAESQLTDQGPNKWNMKTYKYDNQDCKKTEVVRAAAPSAGRTGPGFRIRNDTPWPVEISLWQVGPLYYQLVQPGQYFFREVGAVWFAVKATINMDNKASISDWDAIWPIAVIVLSVILAIVTLGSASALSASVAAGGAAGSVAGSVTASIASVLVGMGVKAGTALYVTTAGLAATKAVITSAGVTFAVKEALAGDLTDMPGDYMKVQKGGVYAGYAWPFEQTTQTIRVTGGPVIEPATTGDECVTLYNKADSSNLKLTCEGGACFL